MKDELKESLAYAGVFAYGALLYNATQGAESQLTLHKTRFTAAAASQGR
jgi:hypothetical protein